MLILRLILSWLEQLPHLVLWHLKAARLYGKVIFVREMLQAAEQLALSLVKIDRGDVRLRLQSLLLLLKLTEMLFDPINL